MSEVFRYRRQILSVFLVYYTCQQTMKAENINVVCLLAINYLILYIYIWKVMTFLKTKYDYSSYKILFPTHLVLSNQKYFTMTPKLYFHVLFIYHLYQKDLQKIHPLHTNLLVFDRDIQFKETAVHLYYVGLCLKVPYVFEKLASHF